jgi:hypothetical protein
LFPQNVSDNHWTLLAVEVKRRKLWWADSLGGNVGSEEEGGRRSAQLIEYLTEVWRLRQGASHAPTSSPPKWTWAIRPSAQQSNGKDCGVYMLAFCFLICADSPLQFTEAEASRWRSRMALLLKDQCLPAPPAASPHEHTPSPSLRLGSGTGRPSDNRKRPWTQVTGPSNAAPRPTSRLKARRQLVIPSPAGTRGAGGPGHKRKRLPTAATNRTPPTGRRRKSTRPTRGRQSGPRGGPRRTKGKARLSGTSGSSGSEWDPTSGD